MTKKGNVQFNRERRSSKSSMSESNGDVRSPSRSSGAKSPSSPAKSNGGLHNRLDRPHIDGTDTSASGWATENDDEDKVGTHITY
jgi:phosphatidate cytidylyltransferase